MKIEIPEYLIIHKNDCLLEPPSPEETAQMTEEERKRRFEDYVRVLLDSAVGRQYNTELRDYISEHIMYYLSASGLYSCPHCLSVDYELLQNILPDEFKDHGEELSLYIKVEPDN